MLKTGKCTYGLSLCTLFASGDISSAKWRNQSRDSLFTGTLPTSLGLLEGLMLLRFSRNNDLTGTIPTELGSIPLYGNLSEYSYSEFMRTQYGLPSAMELSSNKRLAGTVPTELSTMSGLKWLYLHDNALIGIIPTELGLLNLER